MEIQVLNYGQLKGMKLKGPFRGSEANAVFRRHADEMLQAGGIWLVVDLADVPAIDSTGIGNLVYLLSTCKRRGGMVKLVRPSDSTGNALQLTGLLSLFEVFDSIPRAVASFRE
ncbi:MAG TPA: STAS domain-containing protein [Terriglobales bacterium]|nr:STAS domain-containing protein [Terriglobales bacterium]